MLDALEAIRTHQVIFVFVLGGLVAFLGWAFVSRVKQLVEDRARAVDLVSVGGHVNSLEARVVSLEHKFLDLPTARQVSGVEARISSLEQKFADLPTARQMNDIAVSLAQIRGELQAGAERFKGLEALLERTTQQADSIDQFLRTRTS